MSKFDDRPVIEIPDAVWEETGDYANGNGEDLPSWSRLLTSITINGTPLHLEAYALQQRDDDEQHIMDDDVDQNLGRIVGDDAWPLTPTEIRGREYILIATPFGD